MLSLVGGELYQWDTGRVVKVVPDENVTVHEVHFSTKRMDYAYVLKTYIEDGVTYCAIPNLILQQFNRLLCYEVCQNSDGEETIADAYFDIIKRNRPEDYVYTEQEHFTFVKLENRLDKLEESSHTHGNKTELDTITEEDLETWRNPNSSIVTGGAQVGTLFKDLEVTTTLAEDASEWTGASSQPFKCTFRPSPGQTVYANVEGLNTANITSVNISPEGDSETKTVIGNYSVVNSKVKYWYNDGASNPPTPSCLDLDWCFVFDYNNDDSDFLTPDVPICTLYTKTPGTYKVTVITIDYSIDPQSVTRMYDSRPYVQAEYGTYANWKTLTESGKYDLWEVAIKKIDYYNGVYLKEVSGTKYIYLYYAEQKYDSDSGTFTNIDHTLTYDTATETVTCSDSTLNPETDVIISVHRDYVLTVPDKVTSLGEATPDKVGKMLTAVDVGGTYNKWQNSKYQYRWVDVPETKTFYADFDVDADKNVTTEVTPDEIVAAYESGQNVIARVQSGLILGGYAVLLKLYSARDADKDIIFADIVNYPNSSVPGRAAVLEYLSTNKKWAFTLRPSLADKEYTDEKYINAYWGEEYSGKILGIDTGGVVCPVDSPSSGSENAVTYTEQSLTDVQKKQARDNIGAISKLEPLIVTFTSDGSGNWSTDKTFAEVKEAIEAGRFVQGECDDGPLSVYMCTEEMIGFLYSVCLPEGGLTLLASMTSTGQVFCDTMQNNYFDSSNVEPKTDSMIQPVGVDSDGKLWTEIPTKTSQLTNDSGYLTEHQSLEAYAKKTEIPTVPTKVSAFENDSGYLTEHQSLADYAKKTEIPTVPSTDTALSDSSTNPVQNKIIKAELDKKLESIPVDGTTIKLNDQGQLTLALSNANGVNF